MLGIAVVRVAVLLEQFFGFVQKPGIYFFIIVAGGFAAVGADFTVATVDDEKFRFRAAALSLLAGNFNIDRSAFRFVAVGLAGNRGAVNVAIGGTFAVAGFFGKCTPAAEAFLHFFGFLLLLKFLFGLQGQAFNFAA